MKRILMFALFIMLAFNAVAIAQSQTSEQSSTIDVKAQDRFYLRDASQIYKDANLAYENKEYKKAIELYTVFNQLVPKEIDVLYNMACCYALMDDAESAADILLNAAKIGWEEVDAIENDTDFDKVRNSEYFKLKIVEIKEKIKTLERDKGEVRFIKSPAYLPYRVWLPDNFDKSKSYKLIIGLHGFGD